MGRWGMVSPVAHTPTPSLPSHTPPHLHTPTQRKLNEKERLLYAPMADVGDVLYDTDAVYIDMGNLGRKEIDPEAEATGKGEDYAR